MSTYSFTVGGKLQCYFFCVLSFLSPIIAYKFNAPIHIWICVFVLFLGSVAIGGPALTNGYIVLDDMELRYFDRFLFHFGKPRIVKWDSVIKANAFYPLILTPIFSLQHSIDGVKKNEMSIPLGWFSSEMLKDILSRLPKDAEIIISSDFPSSFGVDEYK